MKKKMFQRTASLILSAAVALSAAAPTVSVWAANAAPTTVANCETNGFYTTILNLGFTDTVWLNKISSVTVNGTKIEKGTISSFGSDIVWEVSTYSFNGGAQGDSDALRISVSTSTSFPATIVISADGYDDLTVKVEKEGYSDYTATIVSSSDSGNTGGSDSGSDSGNSELLPPPTGFTYPMFNWGPIKLIFTFDDADWLNAINSVKVDGITYNTGYVSTSSQTYKVNAVTYEQDGCYITIGEGFTGDTATCVISATGYKPLTLKLDKTNHTATVIEDSSTPGGEETAYAVTAENAENGSVSFDKTSAKKDEEVTVTVSPDTGYTLGTLTVDGKDVTASVKNNSYTFMMPDHAVSVSASFTAETVTPAEPGKITLSTDIFGNDWIVSFENKDYVKTITSVKVNDAEWEAKAYDPSSGGAYHINENDGTLIFAKADFSANPTVPVLKSGDVITINDTLKLKLVIDQDGNGTLTEDDGEGDPYQLNVKIEGLFEAAIVGQKDYDGVSGASTGATSNQNSSVTVYGALIKKNDTLADSDWKEMDASGSGFDSNKSDFNVKKCTVNIVAADGSSKDSGMTGSFWPAISSSLTLSGTPKDAGKYNISLTVIDDQGRTATSNSLPFIIYTGEETLADQIAVGNLKQYASGLYAWDIMEPWSIHNFGSNVPGETESVRVPEKLEVWFGSHQSGTYGYLGYDLPWEQVEKGNIPQTLYIPKGCELTLTNMEILSSVRIVVENGGKLTLDDSVVQGIIDVQSGGTFSMNYDAYNKEFKTGASICGQLRLADGATLENAAIYSHANYLANGTRTDRTTHEPVVTATGNVYIKGQVFIKGDAGGYEIGQSALRVKDGTLHLEDGATLVAYGGEGDVVNTKGGTALELDNGTITGNGKLVAIGGEVLWEKGGDAVTGNGTIATSDVFLQGATASESWGSDPGKAVDGNITITSKNYHIADGTVKETTADDPLKDLYWKEGIDPTPPLDKFTTDSVNEDGHIHAYGEWGYDASGHWRVCSCGARESVSVHVPGAPATATTPQVCTICGYVIAPATGNGTADTPIFDNSNTWNYGSSTRLSGWKTTGGNTVYYSNGRRVTGWQEIDGETYYFGEKGALQTGWLQLDGKWYYLDPDTGALQTGWKKVKNTWYYLAPKTGEMFANGEYDIDGVRYCFRDWGGMVETNWIKTEAGWKYFRGNGAMAKNAWILWKEKYYYVTSDGTMLTNAYTPDGYYVNAEGVWVK